MTTTTVSTKVNAGFLGLLAILALVLATAVALGFTSQIGLSDRTAFYILAAVGFTMCGLGKLGQGAVYGWWNIRHIAGYILGSLALLLAVSVFFGWQLPGITTVQTAFYTMAGLILAKVVIGALYPRRKA